MSIKLHPRYFIVAKARSELSKTVCDLAEQHGLTVAEIVSILLEIISSWHVYALRAERHPDNPDKKANEE